MALPSESVSVATGCAIHGSHVKIQGGEFVMGSDTTYPEEGHARIVTIDTFWMDSTEVTVDQFARFVDATGYVTVAEKPIGPEGFPSVDLKTNPELSELFKPGGAVFDPSAKSVARGLNWWTYIVGANWRYPEGPDKQKAYPRHPVTQIAYDDAVAYANWANGRLPTEAEWEYAALAGNSNSQIGFARPEEANTWQGVFPVANSAEDGFENVAPVGCFEANANGLYDMLGNVWEWTGDWYAPTQQTEKDNPSGMSLQKGFDPANQGAPSRVLKGGSFLCADNYCRRYRPAARHPQETGLGTNHIGFRVVYDRQPTHE